MNKRLIKQTLTFCFNTNVSDTKNKKGLICKVLLVARGLGRGTKFNIKSIYQPRGVAHMLWKHLFNVLCVCGEVNSEKTTQDYRFLTERSKRQPLNHSSLSSFPCKIQVFLFSMLLIEVQYKTRSTLKSTPHTNMFILDRVSPNSGGIVFMNI